MKNTALITGSYGGLGKCFEKIHGEKGGDMILVGRSQDKLDAQAKEASVKYGVELQTIAVDLSKPEAGYTSRGNDMIFYFSGSGNSLSAEKKFLLPGEQLVNMADRRRYVNPVLKWSCMNSNFMR